MIPTEVYTILSGLLIAIVTAVVTVRLSLAKFRTEQWWERKADAYSHIIGAVSDIARYLDMLATEHETGAKPTDLLQERYSTSWNDLERATSIGAFIISDRAATALAELRARKRLDWVTAPAWDFFAAESEAYHRALDSLRAEAKRDLQVDR